MTTRLKKGITEVSAVMVVCGLLAFFNQYPPIELLQDQYQERKKDFFQNKYVTDLNNDSFYEYTFDGNGELVKMRLSACRISDHKWGGLNKKPDQDYQLPDRDTQTPEEYYRNQQQLEGYKIKNAKCDLAYVIKDEDGKLHSMKRVVKLHQDSKRGWNFYEMIHLDNGKIYN